MANTPAFSTGPCPGPPQRLVPLLPLCGSRVRGRVLPQQRVCPKRLASKQVVSLRVRTKAEERGGWGEQIGSRCLREDQASYRGSRWWVPRSISCCIESWCRTSQHFQQKPMHMTFSPEVSEPFFPKLKSSQDADRTRPHRHPVLHPLLAWVSPLESPVSLSGMSWIL